MIYMYTGTPGSGKSLHTAKDIAYYIEAGLPVICNFPVNMHNLKKSLSIFRKKFDRKNFHFVDNQDLKPKYLYEFSESYFLDNKFKEGKILLVIDEAQLLFNSREWGKSDRAEWLKFFTQHRHLGFDICLVCQFDRMLDRQIRSLCEYEYIHRKVSNIGAAGQLISLIAAGKLFVSVKIYYPLKEKVSSEFFVARKKYYSIYDTLYMFESTP